MKLAIMQPYFLPYIGYFQLINAVDEFVVYDNIKYTKKGWINRNRILDGNKDSIITLPLKKGSDYLDVKDRYLSDTWQTDKVKMIDKISRAYKNAPFYHEVYPLVKNIIIFEDSNLFNFIFNSITLVKDFLEIKTPLVVSSSMIINHELKAEMKVIEICNTRKARTYINSIGGVELYDKEYFESKGVNLCFLKTNDFKYKQFSHEFIAFLSIIDVLMFNSVEEIKKMLGNYELI